ncbi:uncharacterized protein LOC104908310 [Beta vulgaris subsp. vulgaris]|uniref:uncharacterized protein LOC104908310 n=1 Tax=Beta vulgaris subsp. vulgaris TaxID=3555 RepID=UPI00053FCF25|nr:uncharacterized protein LOC104908310 [Beta vulgaris subsp. vulgaris]
MTNTLLLQILIRLFVLSCPIKNEDQADGEYMMHGRCGAVNTNTLCIIDKQCSKHFPKRFIDATKVDDEGYPVYRRRDNGSTFDKNINKGHNRVTVAAYQDKQKKVKRRRDKDMQCNEKYEEARELTYVEFPTKFVWKQAQREWTPRAKGFTIGRIYHVLPGSGEKFYLRTLLNFVKAATCYEDIRTVDCVVYPTFKEACYTRGLLNDDKDYVDAITKASFRESSWMKFDRRLGRYCLMSFFSSSVLFKKIKLTDDQIEVFALAGIETILQSNGTSLRRFSEMSFTDELIMFERNNKLIADKLSYDVEEITSEHDKLYKGLTDEQSMIYQEVLDVVSSQGAVFFVYGYRGTGKTYVWKTLCAAIRKMGEIVLSVASSGIASLLLPRGRTTHSRFGIPLNVTENSTCACIQPGSNLVALLIKTKFWDEAPMMHKYYFETLLRSLRDIMRSVDRDNLHRPFRGKVMVFDGDLMQILSVVLKGTSQDIMFATVNSSYLWDSCKVLRLTRNMRLQSGSLKS